MTKIRSENYCVRTIVGLILIVLASSLVARNVQAQEEKWGRIVAQINKGERTTRSLDCVIELIFRAGNRSAKDLNDRIINFSIVFPDTTPSPLISVDLLKGSAADEKKILMAIKDFHVKIQNTYKLKPTSSCSYCNWALTLPTVATDKVSSGNVYMFSKTFQSNEGSFKGGEKSTIAFDKKTFDKLWFDEITDNGADVLDIYIYRPNSIVLKKINDGLHQVNTSEELWGIVNIWMARIPQLAEALSQCKLMCNR